EGTNLSEGRGTTRPFEWIGAPYLDAHRYAAALERLRLPGVRFRPARFLPTFQKWAGRLCDGVQIHVTDANRFQPFLTGPAELERRRVRAIDLLERDLPVHVVAERLGVDRRSVRRWKRAHRGQGRAGLRARPASGRPPKLTAAQRRQLARLVVAGPEAAGY